MKNFRFHLEPVKNYKQQRMDQLMLELSEVQNRVTAQEIAVQTAHQTLLDYDQECTRRKEEGMTIVEAMECETSQRVLLGRLQDEEKALHKVRAEAEAKRAQVVEARKELHSLERLEELRHKEFDKAEAKAEEKMLDDLTAARRFADSKAG